MYILSIHSLAVGLNEKAVKKKVKTKQQHQRGKKLYFTAEQQS